jgi:two-component system cell cycle response regulator
MTMACAGESYPPLDDKDKAGSSHQLTVALLGFETADQEKLDRVFQMERRGERKYVTAKNPDPIIGSDILLVNFDNPCAREEKDRILASHPQTQVVAASRGPLQEVPAHHIRGILIAARVLGVLDKIVAPQTAKPVPDNLPAHEADSVSRQAGVENRPKCQVTLPKDQPPPVASAHTGYRALVVDDSAAIQKSLELNLATLPQISAVEFADTGESALAKAEASQYDLIFLDVMMPGMDGFETCTQLRKKPQYKKTPIIMVSGKTSPLDEVKGVMAGCTTYLTKPVQPEAFQKLGARVVAWLEKQKEL